jgi:DNA-binding MarR family transcriptional regulator
LSTIGKLISENTKVTISKICEELELSKPTLTNLLNDLEKKKLLLRKIDNKNRRNVNIGWCINNVEAII